jgi:hypothetical protein
MMNERRRGAGFDSHRYAHSVLARICIPMSLRFILLGLTLLFTAHAVNAQPSVEGRRETRLFELSFAADDKAPNEMFHTAARYWISKSSRGWERNIVAWAVQGGYGPLEDGTNLAKKCFYILSLIGKPDKQPIFAANDAVAFKAIDNDVVVVRRFDRHTMPIALKEIFDVLGVRDEYRTRFTFK